MRTIPDEVVFGCTLRLPEELVFSSRPTNFNHGDYGKGLVQRMRLLHANPPRNQRSSELIPTPFSTSTQVFVRVGVLRPPLRPLYAGPFLMVDAVIISRFWTLPADNTLSIDNIKPAPWNASLTTNSFHLTSPVNLFEPSHYRRRPRRPLVGLKSRHQKLHPKYRICAAAVASAR